MNSDMIKEFLVGLGFKVDAEGLKKFLGVIDTTTKGALELGVAVTAMAAETVAAVSAVSERFEDLYYASLRIKDSVGNIKDYDFAIGQVGGTAKGSLSSLEAVASFMRSNPGGEKFINMMGVATRDGNKHLRETTLIMDDLGKKFASMPFFRAKVYANLLGIDEKTLIAMRTGIHAVRNEYSELYKAAGIDPQKAAKSAQEFMNRLRDLGAQLEVVADIIGFRLMPIADFFISTLEKLLKLIVWLDQQTDGWSTRILAVAAAWGVTSRVLGIFLPMLRVLSFSMIPQLLLQLGLLAEALGMEGLAGAFLAAGAAIEATPIGWILTGIAAIGFAGYELYKHWDWISKKWGELWASMGIDVEKVNTILRNAAEMALLVLPGGQGLAMEMMAADARAAKDGGSGGGPPSHATSLPGGPGRAPASGGGGSGTTEEQAQEFLRKAFPGTRITGGARTAERNAQLTGSAKNSMHLRGQAVDFVLPQGVSAETVKKALIAAGFNVSEFFNEGRHGEQGPHVHWGWGEKNQPWKNVAGHHISVSKTVTATLHSNSEIHVHGSSQPHEVARATTNEQRRVAGDAVRNLKTAIV